MNLSWLAGSDLLLIQKLAHQRGRYTTAFCQRLGVGPSHEFADRGWRALQRAQHLIERRFRNRKLAILEQLSRDFRQQIVVGRPKREGDERREARRQVR